MKIVKSYFLFFSEYPIIYSLIGFMLNAFCFMTINVNYMVINHVLALKFFYSINIILVLNLALVIYISNRFITGVDSFSEWFSVLVFENGKKVILNRRLWGKGKIYSILCASSMHDEPGGKLCFSIDINGRYKNSSMCIPIKITLELDNECDKMEIFEILYEHNLIQKCEDEDLSLSSFIQYVFERFNEKFQPEINQLTGKYAHMEISQPYLLNSIIDMLIFPERVFSNVKNVRLCLGDPTFSSCKGLVECSS